MQILGLTGSIGMGKSTVATMLAEMGLPSHDSDETARAAIGPNGSAVEDVARVFPEAYNAKTNSINRRLLGPVVFADPAKKKILEDIVHPHVWASQQAFIKMHQALGTRAVVLDIPLLYETGAEKRVDKVIVVSCPAFMQRRRVLARDGMTEEKFRDILKVQMPDHEKRRRADFVVQTGIGLAFTRNALKRIIQQLNLSSSNDQNRSHLPPFSL